MADKNENSHSIDKKLQALASSITQQVSAIIEESATDPLTPQQIDALPQVVALKEKISELQRRQQEDAKTFEQRENNFQQQLADLSKQISSQADNNDVSALEAKCKSLKEQLAEQVALQETIDKNAQAKTATLDVQNQQISQLNSQLNEVTAEFEHFQANTEQQQVIQQQQLSDTTEELSNFKKLYAEKEQDLTKHLTKFKQYQKQQHEKLQVLENNSQSLNDEIANKNEHIVSLMAEITQHQENTEQLEKKVTELTNELTEVNQQLATSEDSLVKLQQEVTQHQERIESQQAKKQQQETEYAKARETIKYLRDENQELSAKYTQTVNELEQQVTEYRLRFEYAQKELAKKQ